MSGIYNTHHIGAGKLLYDARKANGTEVANICFGLCDEQTYYRIENGFQEPDGLLFAFLWERIGVSLRRVNIVLTEDEIEWFFLKGEASEALRKNDPDQAEIIRTQMLALKSLNRQIVGQFTDYLDYAIIMMRDGFSAEAYRRIKESVTRTMGDPFRLEFTVNHPGQEEMQILCSFLLAEHRLDPSKDKEIHRCILALIKHCISSAGDFAAYAGALSRLAATECVCFGRRADNECIEAAVNIMRKAYSVFDLPLLLTKLGDTDSENSERYRKWGTTLQALASEFGCGYTFREEKIYIHLPHINEVSSFIRSGRVDKGLTQAMTSEGICEPENYSRIETGRRKPRSSNLKSILNRLNLEWGYYNGIIVTNRYECFVRRIEAEHAIRLSDYELGLELLELLELELDMNIPQNRQYCSYFRINTKLRRGEMTPEDAVIELLSLLKITGADSEKIRFYSPQESTIMLDIAHIYRRKLKSPVEADRLIERFVKNEMRKRLPDTSRIYQFYRIKAGIYGDLQKWTEEEKLALAGIEYIFRSECAEMLEQFIDLYIEGMERGKASSKNAKRLHIAAMYMAELYYEQSNADLLHRFIKEQYKAYDSDQ